MLKINLSSEPVDSNCYLCHDLIHSTRVTTDGISRLNGMRARSCFHFGLKFPFRAVRISRDDPLIVCGGNQFPLRIKFVNKNFCRRAGNGKLAALALNEPG